MDIWPDTFEKFLDTLRELDDEALLAEPGHYLSPTSALSSSTLIGNPSYLLPTRTTLTEARGEHNVPNVTNVREEFCDTAWYKKRKPADKFLGEQFLNRNMVKDIRSMVVEV